MAQPNILLACQDVGPAKYLLALAKTLRGFNIYTTSVYPATNILGNHFRPITLNAIQGVIDLVITGTSLGCPSLSYDKRVLLAARSTGIPVVSVIEHWSLYKERFLCRNKPCYPDAILVNDTKALESAIQSGLPPSIIFPLGNPYFESIQDQKLDPSQQTILRNRLGIPEDKRIVVFVSESLRTDFVSGDESYWGYDEYTVLEDIKACLHTHDHLIIKLHPSESPQKYASHLCPNTTVLSSCDFKDLGSLADKIVGMASILLLELSLLRRDIISYRPNSSKPFIGQQLGVTLDATSVQQLYTYLSNDLSASSPFNYSFSGSSDRIKSFLYNLLS